MGRRKNEGERKLVTGIWVIFFMNCSHVFCFVLFFVFCDGGKGEIEICFSFQGIFFPFFLFENLVCISADTPRMNSTIYFFFFFEREEADYNVRGNEVAC